MNINKEELNTGDILLFHHVSKYNNCYNCVFSCFTDLIKYCTHSKYSHIGIIVRDPNFSNVQLKGLYVLESSFELFPDAEDHRYKLGVELEDFDKVIKNSGGDIYIRKLNCERNEDFYKTLDEIHTDVYNKPYDALPRDWVDAVLHKYSGSNAQSTNHFWCSALVAYIYVRWGFLPSYTPWSLVSPKMFGTETDTKYKLEFLNCSLDNEIKID